MKNAIKVNVITLLLSIGVANIQAQMATNEFSEEDTCTIRIYDTFQDSILKSKPGTTASIVIQGGFGFGYMMNGGFFAMNLKFIGLKGWGTSFDFKAGAAKTKNLPSNYTPLFYPMDNRTVVSLNVVKVLTGHGRNPRISVGMGPSWVRIDNTVISPNPDYDPNNIWHLRKYFQSREVKKAPGLSMSLGTEILLTSFMTMDVSVFGNLNKAASFLGIGLYFNFGDVID